MKKSIADTLHDVLGNMKDGFSKVFESVAKQMSDIEKVGAGESIEDRAWRIRSAFYEKFVSRPSEMLRPEEVAVLEDFWANEIYDEYIIASNGLSFFKIKYEMRDGEPMFAEPAQWEQVERAWQPIMKKAEIEKASGETSTTADHKHTYEIDEDGNGETSTDLEHNHKVVEFSVQQSNDHSHTIEKTAAKKRDVCTKALKPTSDMTTEEKRKGQQERAKKYGIEPLDNNGERLAFPVAYPTDLEDYADPVNLKFPIDTKGRAASARVDFKTFAISYEKDESRQIVHNRIVRGELKHGIVPSYDVDCELDKLLTSATLKMIDEAAETSRERAQKAVDANGVIEHKAKICKIDVEERLVYGVVLEPDSFDSQDDTISGEEIKKTSHNYMMENMNLGFMHSHLINHAASIVESYLAPQDMQLNDELVKKGAWILVTKIANDELWGMIKRGEITGYSIGGHAERQAVE